MRLMIACLAAGFLMIGPLMTAAAGRWGDPLDPDRGLYAIWFRDAQRVFDLPFIRGGQIFLQWADLEPAESRYDFTRLDEKLAEYHRMGRRATVQVNGNRKPAYLYSKVAVNPERWSRQSGDEQGTLQYWDPLYVSAYRNFVLAYGRHLRESPLRDACLGVRLNFNAIGTEHGNVPREQRAPSRWKPAPDGRICTVPWTWDVFHEYQRTIVETFVEAFRPDVRVFVRNNIFRSGVLGPEMMHRFQTGDLALFHTSSEFQPRSTGVQAQYEAFLRHARGGLTVAYAEPWADSVGRHGGITDPRTCSPAQWNYWRLLVDLHCGVSFIAIYGADLARADDPEYHAAYEFAARYAGFHASASESPGAWVALREGDFLRGDYTFLMSRAPGSDPGTPLTNVGPPEQRHGAWARAIDEGERLLFRLDAAFASSLRGKPCRLRVVFLDEGAGALTMRWDTGGAEQSHTMPRQNTGRWREEIVPIPAADFRQSLHSADIAVSGTGTTVVHMVEVMRGESSRYER